jgi:tetratricopeptide (TPR) repeat protein
MKKYLYILVILFTYGKTDAQMDSCVAKHLNFLICKSNNDCSEGQEEVYHQNIIAQFQYIEALYPNEMTSDAYNQWGKEYYYLKKFDSAIHYYKQAIQLHDTSSNYDNNVGTVFFMQGIYDSSYYYFNKAYERDTTNEIYLNNLASYFGTVGKYKKSISLSLKSYRYHPTTTALNSLIISYGFLNNKNEVKHYQKLLKQHQKKQGGEPATMDCECTKYKPDCEI